MKLLLNITFGLLLAAIALSGMNMFSRKKWIRYGHVVLLSCGCTILTVYMIFRWIVASRAPFSNMFESLVLFAWSVVVIYLFLYRRIKMPIMGVMTSMFALLALAYASAFKSDIEPLIPALKSNWLTVHVFTCFLGYAGFTISFLASTVYLASTSSGNCRSGGQDVLEIVMEGTITFGFMFLTLGIITGSVWANTAWGAYWQWDPKETWSLVTWLVYAGYLHLRYMRGWNGKTLVVVSLVGYICVLFTYLGVNYIPIIKSLHTYSM